MYNNGIEGCLLIIINYYDERNSRSNSFLIIPPVSSIEDQDISISPVPRHPVHHIQLECGANFFVCTAWGPALQNQKWGPVVLHSTVILAKFKHQVSHVLGYWVAINFINSGFI